MILFIWMWCLFDTHDTEWPTIPGGIRHIQTEYKEIFNGDNCIWRCSNHIFILDLTPGFNTLRKDNCKVRRKAFKFWNLVRLILDVFCIYCAFCYHISYPCLSSEMITKVNKPKRRLITSVMRSFEVLSVVIEQTDELMLIWAAMMLMWGHSNAILNLCLRFNVFFVIISFEWYD